MRHKSTNQARRYKTPKITIKKIKTSFFYNNSNRFLDSLNELLDIGVYAQSGGCSGGSSSSKADVCFLPHTLITLKDKTKKRIDQISIGEEVLVFNIDDKTFGSGKVTDIEHHLRPDGYFVLNGKLHVTDDHPVRINDEWRKVKDVKKNDIVQLESGEHTTISSIEYIKNEIEVYNIQVVGDSTCYFAEGILVNSYSL